MRFLLQKAFSTSNKLPKVFLCSTAAASIPVFLSTVAVTAKETGGSEVAFICIHIVLLQDPTKSRFCSHDQEIEQAYVDLLDSSKQTLGSMLELQEVQLPALIFFFNAML